MTNAWLYWILLPLLAARGLAIGAAAADGDAAPAAKPYRIVNDEVDERTYEGFRRYHASCNHCHGPYGLGSTFAPSLIADLADAATFRLIVLGGRSQGTSVMKGFADDSNVAPYVDAIYSYLRARADGALGTSRPNRMRQK